MDEAAICPYRVRATMGCDVMSTTSRIRRVRSRSVSHPRPPLLASMFTVSFEVWPQAVLFVPFLAEVLVILQYLALAE